MFEIVGLLIAQLNRTLIRRKLQVQKPGIDTSQICLIDGSQDPVADVHEGEGIAPDAAGVLRSGVEQQLPRGVPPGVGVVDSLQAALDDADRRVLGAASVQGVDFDSSILAGVLELDQDEVEDRLERLEREPKPEALGKFKLAIDAANGATTTVAPSRANRIASLSPMP